MRLPPHPRSGARVLVAMLSAVILAGCAVPSDPFGAPSRSPMSCPPPAAADQLVDLPTSLVPGLSLDTQADEALQVHVSTPVLPGLASLNAALVDEVSAELDRFRADPGDELNVSWNLVGVSSRSVGVALQTSRRDAARSRSEVIVRWYDRADARMLTSTDLFTGDGWQQVAGRMSRDLCRPSRLTPETSVGFGADGSVLLTDSSGSGQPELYAVPAAEALPWLSPLGRDARSAAVAPEALPALAPSATSPLGPTAPVTTPPAKPTQPEHGAKKNRSTKHRVKKAEPARSKVDCRRQRCVALTFDDGPGPYTERLIRTLRAVRAPATFFMIGEHVDALPTVAAQVAEAGFEVGSHTYSHPDLTKLSSAELTRQLERSSQALTEATGQRPTLLRPPYGARNAKVDRAAARLGQSEVLWDVDTLDWKHRDPVRIGKAVKKQVRRGSIVLLHDIHPTTVQAVPSIIAELRRSGYTLVTVSQLIGSPRSGSVHFRSN